MTDAFESKPAGVPFSRNNETVLVVEEDPDLRQITLSGSKVLAVSGPYS
jgi:hypothetical protein